MVVVGTSPLDAPPAEAVAAILAPATQVTRRVDIYEEDGETAWMLNAPVTSGNVAVDQSRAERRIVDLVFDNSDNALDSYPGGFWYDKVLKVYRGVEWESRDASAVLLDGSRTGYLTTPDSSRFTAMPNLVLGVKVALRDYSSGSNQTLVAQWDEVLNRRKFAFVIDGTGKPTLLWSNDGTTVVTFESPIPLFLVDRAPVSLLVVLDTDDGAGGSLATFYGSTDDGLTLQLLGTDTHGSTLSTAYDSAAPLTIGAHSSDVRARAHGVFYEVEVRPGEAGPAVTYLDLTGLRPDATVAIDTENNFVWNFAGPGASIIDGQATVKSWERQVGEFMIDQIESPNFPHQVSITGRDYTKKLLEDTLDASVMFAEGTPIEAVVHAVAFKSGIPKFLLPETGFVLDRDFPFEGGTARWTIIKDIAEAYNYEVFFTGSGHLTMREFRDPVTSPETFTFETGDAGSLASYRKRASDARMYNAVTVVGEGNSQLPVVAVAENHEPSSPTSIENLNRRKNYRHTSSAISTGEQAQQLADSFLAVMALESYDISMQAIVIPWLNEGDVVRFIDPDPNPGEPDRLLLTDFGIPIALGTMSATGKRVTVVG